MCVQVCGIPIWCAVEFDPTFLCCYSNYGLKMILRPEDCYPGAFSAHVTQNAGRCYAMRSTLAQYDSEKNTWVATPDEQVSEVPVGLAARLSAVFSCRTTHDLTAALADVGVVDPSTDNLKSLCRILSGHVLVLLGPAVGGLWRRHDQGREVDGNDPDLISQHTHALCTFCVGFALHGTCEHAHVALHAAEKLSLVSAQMPARRATAGAPSPRSARGAALSPGRPASRQEGASASVAAAQPRARMDSALHRALVECGLEHMKDPPPFETLAFLWRVAWASKG
jgi:hypothetical protein